MLQFELFLISNDFECVNNLLFEPVFWFFVLFSHLLLTSCHGPTL